MDTSDYKIFLIGYMIFQVIAIIVGLLLLGVFILSAEMIVLGLLSVDSRVQLLFSGIIIIFMILLTISYICISPIALYATYKALQQQPLTKFQKLSARVCPALLTILSMILLIPFFLSLFW